jgi:hypothetical protein
MRLAPIAAPRIPRMINRSWQVLGLLKLPSSQASVCFDKFRLLAPHGNRPHVLTYHPQATRIRLEECSNIGVEPPLKRQVMKQFSKNVGSNFYRKALSKKAGISTASRFKSAGRSKPGGSARTSPSGLGMNDVGASMKAKCQALPILRSSDVGMSFAIRSAWNFGTRKRSSSAT